MLAVYAGALGTRVVDGMCFRWHSAVLKPEGFGGLSGLGSGVDMMGAYVRGDKA